MGGSRTCNSEYTGPFNWQMKRSCSRVVMIGDVQRNLGVPSTETWSACSLDFPLLVNRSAQLT